MLNNLLLGQTAADALYVEDVFSTWLYAGTGWTGGTSQSITNGIDLAGKGGLIWTKSRSGTNGADQHTFMDTNRGVNNWIASDSTGAQVTYANMLNSFNSNGYTLGTDTTGGKVNYAGTNYASWTFRKAPKFFDVVTFTSNSAKGATFSHSLGASPGMVIVKRTGAAENWWTWHRSLSSTQYLSLNATDAATTGTKALTADSTSVTLADGWLEGASATYVAYLFAHDTTADGIVQCGSWTGNTTVTLGWEPQFIIAKNVSTGSWWIFDNMRGMSVTGSTTYFLANTSDAESASGATTAYVAPTPTGFTTDTWGSATIIYLAIRRGPMRTPTDATKVLGITARTGTNANTTVTGLDAADAAIIKARASAQDPVFSHRLVGNAFLQSNLTAAELADTTVFQANAWDVQNGVKVGGDGRVNAGTTYINYLLRRAPGFFDVVCYTGTGAARTVSHNLRVAPELMIAKNRQSATQGWAVYFGNSGSYLLLNSTAVPTTSSTIWNNTSPTVTSFSLGGTDPINRVNDNCVAYLFASCPGVSKVGSYTGNGSSQNIDCGFTNGARFVLIKRTDSTGDWYVWDTARGIIAANDPHLSLNTTAAEVTTNDTIDPLSTGFTVNQVAATNVNVNAATYIYLAIA